MNILREHTQLQTMNNFYQFSYNQQSQSMTNNLNTNQCGIETMDKDGLNSSQNIILKRNKKKQYKKRRRQRDRENEKKAKIQLGEIIQQIYQQQTTFTEKQKQIQKWLIFLEKGDKFHLFLNHVIRIYINSVQKRIQQYAQESLQELPKQQQGKNNFYLKMINKIYMEYQLIAKSSQQIQMIISLYVKITSDKQYSSYQDYNYKDLDKSIFNYLIESDKKITDIIFRCNQKIEKKNLVQYDKLMRINDIIKFCQNRDYQDYYQEQEEEQTQKSTSIEGQQSQNQKKQQKHKKKKKVKDSQILSEFITVMERLDSFSIDQNQRMPCRISQEWLNQIENNIANQIKQK